MSEPHNHHYIPQFWLKRFSDDGQSKLVWSYDWNKDTIEKRSTKVLMSGYDLYTRKASTGDDNSLETGELGVVDSSAASLFLRLDLGERTETLREELADFFAVMALRHPVTVGRHPIVAAGFLIMVQEIIASASNVAELDAYFAGLSLPASGMHRADFTRLKAATSADLDASLTSIFEQI